MYRWASWGTEEDGDNDGVFDDADQFTPEFMAELKQIGDEHRRQLDRLGVRLQRGKRSREGGGSAGGGESSCSRLVFTHF